MLDFLTAMLLVVEKYLSLLLLLDNIFKLTEYVEIQSSEILYFISWFVFPDCLKK